MNPIIHLFLAGFFSVVPMIIYLVIIWWMDRYEREPFWLVSLNFLWGATGAIIFGIIGSIIMGLGVSEFIYQFANESDAGTFNNLAGAVIVAPVVEEMTKGIFLLMIALSKNFDGPVDGAVYGGAVGLGFGMTENFLYFMSFPQDYVGLFMLIIIRTLFSAVLHCCCQAVFGAAIGYAKFKGMFAKMTIIPLGLGLAMFMHFMWNLTVSFNSTALIGFAFMIMSVIIIFVVFQFAVHNEGKIILRELTDEANTTGYIPREHLAHLPFTSKRGKKGWLANHINHKDYVKTAIKLAIRKNQTKSLKANKQAAYQREVDALRSRIYTMVFYQQQKTQ
ncbi:MAG TPA: PrsW family intramembrane metalloprotease [Ignavibacteria bacterium]|nr:PrsW family intramembrane metalloprotease [Ignavibacteria bacterium]HRE10552.1 PrsW family intramembrane metalloprotease [Ignavibacteria bacterium]HRF64841.1 PrsW family intramembrane metalloprotease [Ignavibacteria bacterium]HRJ04603.1 PrsW family intramembrane metalloprotease [Ignavibacteria bacterium]HRJ86871.1 PrsW family intramembrane metalloprotease [Ignavibacteria bacterium]